ncbi:MAG: NADPH-dependent FMN reductase [Aggregatilineales bacterium]
MASAVHVLGFAGSLRKRSYNRGLLRAAGEMLPEGMTLEIYDLSPLPLYNEENDGAAMSEVVRDFRKRIIAADALLMASPEYNYSISGVLKNAIDLASRPSPEDKVFPLFGKPLGIVGASGGNYGTARSQYDLRKIAVFVNMLPFNKPEVLVTRSAEKFDAEGNLTDPDTRTLLRQHLEALAAWTRRLRGEKL